MNATALRMTRLYSDTPRERKTWLACVLAACLLHSASVFLMRAGPAIAPPTKHATEVQLIASSPRPSLPEPTPEPPPRAARDAHPAPKRAAKRVATPAEPTPAPAPALLTAADQPTNAAPVRFATDPNGRGYASGRVAASGTSAARAEPAMQPVAASTFTPADQLQRQPTWLGDDCHGYFPDEARTDLGEVALVALVRPDGSVARLDTQNERPTDQGFARAARACLQHQRFAPALDRKGNATLARTLIRLRFSR